MRAVAYYNFGRWVADCPGIGCTNAMAVARGQEQFACRFMAGPPHAPHIEGCGTTAPLEWPPDPNAIEAGLSGEPESFQHWGPA